jgi:regulator of protease activity HflC (stomatin/prohibitin superfamily)
MSTIIIGLLIAFVLPRFAAGLPAGQGGNMLPALVRSSRMLGIGIALLGVAMAGIKQINPGEVGVQSLFGKVQQSTLESGLHFINPLAEVTRFDSRTLNYTMSAVRDEGDRAGDDAIRVLTADGLEVIMDLTVLYRIIPSEAPKILQEIGKNYTEKVVRPITRTKIRDNAVYYDAVSLFSTKRDDFQSRIFKSIEEDFKARGLILEQILVRNIELPASVKTTIESKINAVQESEKMKFVLDKEKQEADRKRVEAQGIADYQRIISSGLGDKQLQYEMISAYKELAKSPNTKIIMMPAGKGSVMVSTDK